MTTSESNSDLLKGSSFSKHWQDASESFRQAGIWPSLPYPILNEQINGLILKALKQGSDDIQQDTIAFNPQKNAFLDVFKQYLKLVNKHYSATQVVIESLLEKYENVLNTLLEISLNNQPVPFEQISGVVSRVFKLYSFTKFNFETHDHLMRKIHQEFTKLQINIRREGMLLNMADQDFNIIFGCLQYEALIARVQYLLHKLLEKESAPEKIAELEKLQKSLAGYKDLMQEERTHNLRILDAETREAYLQKFDKLSRKVATEVETDCQMLERKDRKSMATASNWEQLDLNLINLEVNSKRMTTGMQSQNAGDTPIDEETTTSVSQFCSRNYVKYVADITRGASESVACYSVPSAILVLLHTFTYMLTYYGITPTTYDFNTLLDMKKQYFGLMSAFAPLIAGITTILYNIVLVKKKQYKPSYFVSLVTLLIGAFSYSIAFTWRSFWLNLLGRFCFGAGGARILTRTFMSKEIHIEHRIKYSAFLVGLTSMSMTFGPGLSALLETTIDSQDAKSIKLTQDFLNYSSEQKQAIVDRMTGFSIGVIKFSRVNYVTLVTFIMFAILIFVYICVFKDPEIKKDLRANSGKKSVLEKKLSKIEGIQGLSGDSIKQNEDNMQTVTDFKKKLASAQKYFTDFQTYYVCGYFLLMKAIQEAIMVETPIYIVSNYALGSAVSGLVFFCFTVLTLPLGLTPALLKKKFEDRKMIVIFSLFLIVALLIKIQYTDNLYPLWLFIAGSALVLGFSLSVETCCSSVITKVISEKKANSFWNAGIMGGLIDTFGRVAGSTSITVITAIAPSFLTLDEILYPFWLLVFLAMFLWLFWMYNRLDTKVYFRFG